MTGLFEEWGISLSEKHFTPHMTLMKLSKAKFLHKKGSLSGFKFELKS